MLTGETEAQALLRGDRAAAARLASRLLQPLNDNFVERPWGGFALYELKTGTASSTAASQKRIGEAFEIAADDSDEEASRYPSQIRLDDGSLVSLPALLAAHGETLLGPDFVARHGKRWPLLPKMLDIAELLSVQAHPRGNTEVYVIVSADPGATIRLGFKVDVDAASLEALVVRGRRDQQRLLELCGSSLAAEDLQRLLQAWLGERHAQPGALESQLRPALGDRFAEAVELLDALHGAYWEVLDLMNEIPVSAGQVVYNATPPRIAGSGARSAEVHALGNPQGREIVALEIRRPGPTFRAWDNVRFPLRPVDAGAALAALNLKRTEPAEFLVELVAVPGRRGVKRSVDADYRLEHLEPTALVSVDVPAAPPHSLHVLSGAVTVYATDGVVTGRLACGDSALVPIGVGAYRVAADREPAHVLRAEIAA